MTDELARTLDMFVSIAEHGAFPDPTAIDALIDQCSAAWKIDDDATAPAAEAALALLRHAATSSGDRMPATRLAFGALLSAMS